MGKIRSNRRGSRPAIMTLVVAAALFSSVSAQQFPSQNREGTASSDSSRREASPIVRVSGRDRQKPQQGDYMLDWGTGTIIADDGKAATVYTAWHVLKDSIPESITVHSPNGRTSFARIIAKDVENDLAALRITSPGIQPIQIDPSGNFQGPVIVGGYGSDSRLRLVAGDREAGNWTQPGLVFISANVRQGDSGGPAISDGRLVGILWGGTPNGQNQSSTAITTGVPFARFHEFVFRDGRAINLTACQSCGGGGMSCEGGSCSMQGGCSDGSCSMGGSGQGRSVYTSQGVPDRYVGTTPLSQHPEIVSLKNQLTQISQSIANINNSTSGACSCEAKWKELDEYKFKLQEWTRTIDQKISAIKSCTCPDMKPPATTSTPPQVNTEDQKTITQLNETIAQLKIEIESLKNKPSSNDKDAVKLEGVVTRVPK